MKSLINNVKLRNASIPSRYVQGKEKGRADIVGKVRLAKWFQTLPTKQKTKIVKDVTQLVLARRTRMCNFLEYKGKPI